MDQSKGNMTPDEHARVTAMTVAISLHQHAQYGGPEFFIDTVRDIYLFMTGRDEVVDKPEPVHMEGPEGHTCDLYYLDHFRGLKRGDPDE